MGNLLYLHCPYCSRYEHISNSRETLMRALRSGYKVKKQRYTCQFCNKSFKYWIEGKWLSNK